MKKTILLLFILLFCNFRALASEMQTLILFDSSVSMMQKLDSKPKYLWAIEEALGVLEKTTSTMQIGLRTIGISRNTDLTQLLVNPALFCSETSLTVPIGQNNKGRIKNELKNILPLGSTPLTYSLDMAIQNDFNKDSFKHIILITDGGESCGQDPCTYIRNIMKNRNDILIDIIAIGVKENDLEALECLSGRTSGKVINVEKPNDFKKAFDTFINAQYNTSYKILAPKEKKYKHDIIYKNYVIESYI